jgi:hypothetical protein
VEAAVANRKHRSRALFCVVLATFACDVHEGSTLEIVVRVEPRSQLATASPAQVLVGFDDGSGYVVFQVGVVCGPTTDPFVTTSRFSTHLTGDAATVDAWLVPLHAGAAFTCGPMLAPRPVPPPPARFAGVQGTSAQVAVLAGCGIGEVRSATLVIGSR